MTCVARRGIVSGARMPECLCDETRSVLTGKLPYYFLSSNASNIKQSSSMCFLVDKLSDFAHACAVGVAASRAVRARERANAVSSCGIMCALAQ